MSDDIMLGTTTTGYSLDAPVTLNNDDRRRHLYIVGKTGTGKSTLLLSLILQDLSAGRGIALLDPHGDLAETVIAGMPPERVSHCVYWNPADLEFPVAFNPLEAVAPDRRPLAAAHIVSAFKHIWAESWGPRLEYLLTNSIRLLLDGTGSTLLGLPALLVNLDYRTRLLTTCRDPQVRNFWTTEISAWGEGFTAEALSPLQNKAGALLTSPLLRNILGQPTSTLDIAAIMNGGRPLIVNLAKGKLGEGPSYLLGALIASSVAQAAEARAAIPEHARRDFHLYADEFQNFISGSFGSMLAESRKYHLALTLAHQFTGQLPPLLRQAVLGNTGSIVAFRVGAEDAQLLAPELGLQSPAALTDLGNFEAWARLVHNGVPTDTIRVSFSEPALPRTDHSPAIIARTRSRHARPRAMVEAKIERFLNRPMPPS